jgi:hypothetical protein
MLEHKCLGDLWWSSSRCYINGPCRPRPDDGGLWNVGKPLLDYTAQQARRQTFLNGLYLFVSYRRLGSFTGQVQQAGFAAFLSRCHAFAFCVGSLKSRQCTLHFAGASGVAPSFYYLLDQPRFLSAGFSRSPTTYTWSNKLVWSGFKALGTEVPITGFTTHSTPKRIRLYTVFWTHYIGIR